MTSFLKISFYINRRHRTAKQGFVPDLFRCDKDKSFFSLSIFPSLFFANKIKLYSFAAKP